MDQPVAKRKLRVRVPKTLKLSKKKRHPVYEATIDWIPVYIPVTIQSRIWKVLPAIPRHSKHTYCLYSSVSALQPCKNEKSFSITIHGKCTYIIDESRCGVRGTVILELEASISLVPWDSDSHLLMLT
jgi:hypothetical protein